MKFFSLFDPEKKQVDFVGMLPKMVMLAVAIPLISLVSIPVFGVNWGIDFSGGTELRVKFEKAVASDEVRKVLKAEGFKKAQVQVYGVEADHEMLVRIERVTTMSQDDVKGIGTMVAKEMGLAADAVKTTFNVDAGDRVQFKLPVPATTAPRKVTDAARIDAALTEATKAAAEGEPAKAVDDGVLAALSGKGFDRAAVTSRAKALNLNVTASAAAQREPAVNNVLLLEKALDAQKAKLTALLDAKSGFKLRRSKLDGAAQASTDGSVMRDEPHEGKVTYTVQFQGVTNKVGKALAAKFGGADILSVDFVDSQVSQQLRTDGLLAVLIALFCILVYVWLRFDFFFSPGAIVALLHDAFGAFALFTIFRLEFDLPSVAALLTVVGYSINNTIVIYDRIRETMPADPAMPVSEEDARRYVNRSLNDTFSRTVNTSLTTMFASVALWILAGGVVKTFAAVLTAGIVLGAFSSTFVAPAMYLFLRSRFGNPDGTPVVQNGPTREDKARGIV